MRRAFRNPWGSVQAIAASAAVLAGGFGLLYALFGPTVHTVTVTSEGLRTSASYSLIEDGIPALAAAVIALTGALVMVAAVSAILDLRGVRAARTVLTAVTVLLVALSLFLMLTIGYLFLPGVALLLLATFAADRRAERGNRDRTSSGPHQVSHPN